jgi:hypothetical protein
VSGRQRTGSPGKANVFDFEKMSANAQRKFMIGDLSSGIPSVRST